jgi:hypothetical protein
MNRRNFLSNVVAGIAVSQIPFNFLDNSEESTYFKVEVLRVDHVNSNNRLYPREVIEKAIESFKPLRCPLLSKLDNEPINPLDLSHEVRSIFLEGDFLIAEIKPLDTPMGDTLRDIMKKNDHVFRPSGIGNINYDASKTKGICVVSENYRLIGIDVIPIDMASTF